MSALWALILIPIFLLVVYLTFPIWMPMPPLLFGTPARFFEQHPGSKTRLVTPDDFLLVSQQMARSFYDDPTFSAYWPEGPRRGQLMTWWFYIELKYHHYKNRAPVYYLSPGGATAMFLTHKAWKEGFIAQFLLFPVTMWLFQWSWSTRKEHAEMHDEMQSHHPSTPHLYLAMLGVDPAYQRQGLGRIVMEEALRDADENNIDIYLESSNPLNIAFYQRLGFVICAPVIKGRTAVLTPMLRKPRSRTTIVLNSDSSSCVSSSSGGGPRISGSSSAGQPRSDFAMRTGDGGYGAAR